MSQPTHDIAITAQPTANPQVCTFRVDRTLHEGRAVRCRNAEEAAGSPLLEALFGIAEVREVVVMGSVLSVAKDGERGWRELGPDLGRAIRGAVASGGPLIAAEFADRTPAEDEIRAEVEKVLAAHVNPQIASHGGHVEVTDVQGTTVYLVMGGGCQGCASASQTLRHGVEKAIRQYVSAVTEIVDVTDHASGTNPYYR
ncbi:MAG: NifU family protein [Candidatus Krumholzibacteriia bacterium]